ncbi:uncharacterized protein L3040_004089 [Drepanopeziza brunnea f. sp. 'multigermtubi']|uniref:uncharacterized protein n=1 Tax=Drepanopeziza brunnea f. sp. 'multigermtubi' TaxID=698441 RepID=UPI0023843534|nr:hypothetical protein L3040_004089 [Drepanopeziza brunnea f. sp. 'multigermtubi']
MLNRTRDTRIRHAKSYCVNRRRRLVLSENSTDGFGEATTTTTTIFCGNGQSPSSSRDENTIMSSADDAGTSGAIPEYPAADFHVGPTAWDFQSIGFMEDAQLWAVNSGFLLNGTGATGLASAFPDADFDTAEYFGNAQDGGNRTGARGSGTTLPVLMDMRDLWFTKIQRSDEHSRRVTRRFDSVSSSKLAPSPSKSEIVDQECHRELTRLLIRPLPPEDLLPSSGFLNLCVRRFWKCFNPIFPILHEATFQPTAENGLLLISMASVGCLFLGSQTAVQRGRRIFEGLNKVILTSNNSMSNTRAEMIAMVQAALIGQAFAMLSGDARHFAIFDGYHGSMISFARREDVFSGRHIPRSLENLSEEELDRAWKEWVREEEFLRIAPALKIQDAELSSLLHRDSLLKHRAPAKPLLTTDRAFGAASASEWLSAVKAGDSSRPAADGNTHIPRTSPDAFAAYLRLESLGVTIAEDRRQGHLNEEISRNYQHTLLQWYATHNHTDQSSGPGGGAPPDQLCLTSLWHWTFVALSVDLDQLEIAIGRDGPDAAAEALSSYVRPWASTSDAARCAMHAFALQRNLQAQRFDAIPAIHVPRTLFSAAVVWYCFVRYGPGNNSPQLRLDHRPFAVGSWPEFAVLSGSAREELVALSDLTWNRGATSAVTAATLCELGCQLQRINVWGLAGKFAGIVARLLDGWD